VITTGTPGTRRSPPASLAPERRPPRQPDFAPADHGRGEPACASGSHPARDPGQPRPSPTKPGCRLSGTNPLDAT
jgi:hypothetical protein